MTQRINKRSMLVVSALLDWAEVLVGSVFAVIFILTFVFNTATVSGSSMENTLYNGDRLLLGVIGYSPKSGDIVVIDSDELDEYIVKRIIGLSGQTVTIDYIAGQ